VLLVREGDGELVGPERETVIVQVDLALA